MKLMDSKLFFEGFPQKMFYVGFMKSGDSWFPVCSLSDPDSVRKFDSLYVSLDYTRISDLIQSLAKEVQGIEDTFVHYLMREEIQNILATYSLKNIILAHDEEESDGCGCGCGCGGHSSCGDEWILH